jgi:hypothetical protein
MSRIDATIGRKDQRSEDNEVKSKGIRVASAYNVNQIKDDTKACRFLFEGTLTRYNKESVVDFGCPILTRYEGNRPSVGRWCNPEMIA